MKYDNDGYPDLPREPAVTIPRAQHEALMAAVKASTEMMDILKRHGPGWLEYTSPHQGLVKALAALRAAGIDPSEDRT